MCKCVSLLLCWPKKAGLAARIEKAVSRTVNLRAAAEGGNLLMLHRPVPDRQALQRGMQCLKCR